MADKVNNGGRGGNPWLTAAWTTATVIILATPLIAMQFTDEVNWTVSDLVFAGAMLLGAGVTYELAARVGNFAYQAGVVVALGAGVLTLWVTGAVGIIGSENNPGNQLYLAVVALAIFGAIVVGGRAAGMVWAMSLAALATVLAPVTAYFAGIADPRSDVLAPEVYGATAFFAAGWALSARLFWEAARRAKS
jgi:CDP-diglyceride synthetase